MTPTSPTQGSPRKPLVYIAGPITVPEPMENVHKAAKFATELLEHGVVVPFVPHVTCIWHMVTPLDYETWLAYDFDVIRHCQALFRLPGESKGADREVVFAREHSIPVFTSLSEMYEWAEGWRAAA